jgi:hypothetical protein
LMKRINMMQTQWLELDLKSSVICLIRKLIWETEVHLKRERITSNIWLIWLEEIKKLRKRLRLKFKKKKSLRSITLNNQRNKTAASQMIIWMKSNLSKMKLINWMKKFDNLEEIKWLKWLYLQKNQLECLIN